MDCEQGTSPDPPSADNPVGHERNYHYERDADDLKTDYVGGVGVDAPGLRHEDWLQCKKLRLQIAKNAPADVLHHSRWLIAGPGHRSDRGVFSGWGSGWDRVAVLDPQPDPVSNPS